MIKKMQKGLFELCILQDKQISCQTKKNSECTALSKIKKGDNVLQNRRKFLSFQEKCSRSFFR
jgi:hypothetical protein